MAIAQAPPVIGHAPAFLGDVFTAAGRTGAELVEANQAFLDEAIAAGRPFQLATPIEAAQPGSFYEAELTYLIQSAYLPNAEGTMLLPP